MSLLGLEEKGEKNPPENSGKSVQQSNSKVLWIVGIIAFGFLGSMIGRPLGQFMAYLEKKPSSNSTLSSSSPSNLSPIPSPTPLAQTTQPSDAKFTKLKLPLGVSVEVPKNWRILDKETNSTIETAAEASLNLANVDLPTGKKVNLFRANSVPQTTYAGIAINASDSEFDPDILKDASDAEIKESTPMMKEMMEQSLSGQSLKVLEFSDVRREFVGSHPALVVEYKRSGPQGAVIVQMTRLLLKGKEISLNLSYRESEAQLWKPVVQYIRKSLAVE